MASGAAASGWASPATTRRTACASTASASAKSTPVSTSAATLSILPCPYWCSVSAGLPAARTASHVTTVAAVSASECAASDSNASEPETSPAASLPAASAPLATTDQRAARSFAAAADALPAPPVVDAVSPPLFIGG